MTLKEAINTADTVDIFTELTPEEKEEARVQAELAIALTNLRKDLGISQDEFAKRFDVKQSQVSRWENLDGNISLNTFAKIMAKAKRRIVITTVEAEDIAIDNHTVETKNGVYSSIVIGSLVTA